MSVKVAAESWARQTAHPVTGLIDFPSHVISKRPCSSFCRTSTSKPVVQIHGVLLDQAGMSVSHMKNNKSRPMLEVCLSSSHVVACKYYFHLASWMPQAGVFKFRGNFIQSMSIDARNGVAASANITQKHKFSVE